MTSEFWRGRKVFLTGHTGFKGSWLSLWLHTLGAEVTGFALTPPTAPSLFEQARVADVLIASKIGDVRDLTELTLALKKARPEIVIHLAAQPIVRASYEDPVATYATNVMGTVNLLEAVRQTDGVLAVINVTSDKCYENREWLHAYRETDALGGHDPYSSSKGAAELVASAYRRSFFSATTGPRLASVRAGNVIGGGDWAADRLVPDYFRALDAGIPLVIRSPDAVRPWQHVLDPLAGYLILAQKLVEVGADFAGEWNFGSSEVNTRSVGFIASYLCQKAGGRVDVEQNQQLHEAQLLRLDSGKARARLGWEPRCGIKEALDQTVNWHRAWRAGEDMQKVTMEQIAAYQRGPAA